ncbi:MAG TPA: NfeD family protein [Solirubrobacterales bacterium]|nr:NfeD family protein [Solirubrobacterales bacterium]
MDLFVIVALLAMGLLLAELMLPTGGVLAGLGALGLVGAGVYALTAESDSSASDWAGPGLITLGVLCLATSYVVGRKVLAAHRDEPVRTGPEELIGARAEVRTPLDPEGQVWIEGALWRARLSGGDGGAPRPGDRVVVEAVEGLTLMVRPEPASVPTEEGAG